MRAIFQRASLLEAYAKVAAAIPSRDVKPILRNVKASVEPGRCTILATDLEIGIRLDVRGVMVQEGGEAILPARLASILKESTDGELSIEADASSCHVRTDASEFEMPSEDAALFPDVPAFSEESYHEIEADTLRYLIRHTLFAVADGDQARFAMTGVLWELEGNAVKLVATDGRRLALAEGKATGVGEHSTKGKMPLIPTKALSLLERNLSDSPVRVCIRANEVLFRTELATIYSRLIEGRFPDYRQVFPKKSGQRIALPVGPFLTAIRQAAVMADEETRRVGCKFESNRLTLQAQGASTGRSKVQMPVACEGTVEINFNPQYLQEMLRVLPADSTVNLDLIDGATPATFRADNFTCLVMPLT